MYIRKEKHVRKDLMAIYLDGFYIYFEHRSRKREPC